jgi:hypothetical protein
VIDEPDGTDGAVNANRTPLSANVADEITGAGPAATAGLDGAIATTSATNNPATSVL